MRFGKSVKIARGSGLNFSSSSSTRKRTTSKKQYVYKQFRLGIDEKGNISVTYADGSAVEPSVLNKIRRKPEYAAGVAKLRQGMQVKVADVVKEKNGENQELIDVVQYAQPVYAADYYLPDRQRIEAMSYKEETFAVPLPNQSSVEKALRKQAAAQIKGWNPMQVSRQRKEYVDANAAAELDRQMADWYLQKQEFDQQQTKKRNEFAAYQQRQLDYFDALMCGVAEPMNVEIDGMLKDIEMPFDFSVSYETKAPDTVMVDLDLPEIEMLPKDVYIQNKSGTLSVRDKTQADLRMDYVQCVFGYAVVFATKFYAVLPSVQYVVVSGYTQRRRSNGKMNDDYVYSVVFERDRLIGIDTTSVSPYTFCMSMRNSCNLQSSGLLKAIEPYTYQEVCKMMGIDHRKDQTPQKNQRAPQIETSSDEPAVVEAPVQAVTSTSTIPETQPLTTEDTSGDTTGANQNTAAGWDRDSLLRQVAEIGGSNAQMVAADLIDFADSIDVKRRYGTGARFASYITDIFSINVLTDRVRVDHKLSKLTVKNRLSEKRVVEMFDSFREAHSISGECYSVANGYVNMNILSLSDEAARADYKELLQSIYAIHCRAKKK